MTVHLIKHDTLLARHRRTGAKLARKLDSEARHHPRALPMKCSGCRVWVAERPDLRAALDERREQRERTLAEFGGVVDQHEPRHLHLGIGPQHLAGGSQQRAR